MRVDVKSAAAIAVAVALAPCLAQAGDMVYFAASSLGGTYSSTFNVYQATDGGTYSTYATGIAQGGTGLVFDPSKNLYVSSGRNVVKVAPGGGSPSLYSGAITQAPALGGTRPFTAAGLAFDSAGYLAVGSHQETGGSDPANIYINKIAPGGGTGTTAVTQFATVPKAVQSLAYDSSSNLYVTNFYYNQALTKIAPDGTVTSFYTPPNGSAFDTKNYFGLAFDANGNLFVSNFGDASGTTADGTIIKFENVAGVLSNTPTIFATGLVDPHGLSFDSLGNLFVLESYPGVLLEYANVGGSLSTSSTIFASNLPKFGGDIVAVSFSSDVPEPSTWAILMMGLAALGGILFGRHKRPLVAA